MNISIYDYELPPVTNELKPELEFITVIPFKIIKPLSVHNNMLSLLVDLDDENALLITTDAQDLNVQYLSIARMRSYYDLRNYFRDPMKIAFKYTYLGYDNGLHYFVNIDLK